MSLFLGLMDALAGAYLDWLAANLVGRMPFPPARPGPITARIITQSGANQMQLAPDFATAPVDTADPLNSDLVIRELHVLRSGREEQVIRYPFPEPTDEAIAADPALQFVGDDGESIDIFLIHEDDNGNRTIAGPVTSFVVQDTIAPALPGAIGARVIGQ